MEMIISIIVGFLIGSAIEHILKSIYGDFYKKWGIMLKDFVKRKLEGKK